MTAYEPAAQPTLYFIGVTTGQSSIMKVFPAWAKHLGLHDVAIKGIDFPLAADPAAYRDAVSFIRHDPLSRGALVTSHKVDLFAACRDLFDQTDRFAALMHETSCLSKRDGRLLAAAKDPITCGLAMDGFLRPDHFAGSKAEAFCIGAGGSAVAITWRLMRRDEGRAPPARIVVSDRNPARLEEIEKIHREIASGVPVDYVVVARVGDNDRLLAALRPGSLVINATGLGKDRPGSPLSDAARFPERAVVWELNYRGDLKFLAQARAQERERQLRLVDGWTYFIHGWSQVIAEVFDIRIDPAGPVVDALSRIAADAAQR